MDSQVVPPCMASVCYPTGYDLACALACRRAVNPCKRMLQTHYKGIVAQANVANTLFQMHCCVVFQLPFMHFGLYYT